MAERKYPIVGGDCSTTRINLGTSTISTDGTDLPADPDELAKALGALRKSARSLGVLSKPADSVQTHFDNLTE
jgi:hypothetical protein